MTRRHSFVCKRHGSVCVMADRGGLTIAAWLRRSLSIDLESLTRTLPRSGQQRPPGEPSPGRAMLFCCSPVGVRRRAVLPVVLSVRGTLHLPVAGVCLVAAHPLTAAPFILCAQPEGLLQRLSPVQQAAARPGEGSLHRARASANTYRPCGLPRSCRPRAVERMLGWRHRHLAW